MAIDDLVNKGKGLLNSEKAEQVSDDAFAKGSAFASEKTGGKYKEAVDKVQDAAKHAVEKDAATDADKGAEGTAPPA